MPRVPLTILLLLAACSPAVDPPPRPADLSSLDPMVAALVLQALDEVEQTPGEAVPRARLARAYQANGLAVHADAAWRQALAIDDDRARWWYHFAAVRGTLGDAEGAVAALERAADRDESYGPTWWRRGDWLLQLGRLDEAMAMYEEAARREGDDTASEVGRARVHLARGEADAAVAILEPLVRTFPTSGYLQRLIGSAYQQAGRFPDAANALGRVDARPPTFADPWAADIVAQKSGYGAVMSRVDWHVDNGRIANALADLDELARYHPRDAVVLAKRGETLIIGGDLPRARAALDEALRLDPDYHFAMLHMASLLQQKGDLVGAIRQLDRAIEVNPGLAIAWRHKGELHATLENWAEAEDALRQAIRAGHADAATQQLLRDVVAQREAVARRGGGS